MKHIELPLPYGWFAVGFSDELASGDVKAVEYFDKQLVLFRTESGRAVLQDAYCPHLGAHRGYGGTVDGESITCPFHGWKFDSDGQCSEIPYSKSMPPAIKGKACLESYPVTESNRMIFAWYHPRKIEPLFPIDSHPEFGEKDFAETNRHEWELNTHIQEISENSVDFAHFPTVHGARSIGETSLTIKGHRMMTTMKFVPEALYELGEGGSSARPEQRFIKGATCGPGMVYQSLNDEIYSIHTQTPISRQRVHVRWTFAHPKLNEERQALVDAAMNTAIKQLNRDIAIWENKIYLPRPLLCDGDGPIGKFREYFSQFYDEADEVENLTEQLRG